MIRIKLSTIIIWFIWKYGVDRQYYVFLTFLMKELAFRVEALFYKIKNE